MTTGLWWGQVWWVGAGALVGAPARYLVGRLVQTRLRRSTLWGTGFVNVVGSLVLGVLVAATARAQLPVEVGLLVGTGFCGTFTTYSTFAFEVLLLWERKRRGAALGYVAASVVGGVLAAAGGYHVVRILL